MILFLIITIICVIIYYNNISDKCKNKYENYTNDLEKYEKKNNEDDIHVDNDMKKNDKKQKNKSLDLDYNVSKRTDGRKPSKIKNSNKFLKNYELIKNYYHVDYKDIITIINNTYSSSESKFNLSNLPVKNIKINNKDEEMNDINEIVYDFIDELNNYIGNLSEDINVKKTWNNISNEKNMDSGWEKQRKILGLPPSLYNKPAKNEFIELIDIVDVHKYITFGEIGEEKLSLMIILKKLNVKDMILIKIDFLKNMFNDNSLIIDNIYIIGYIMKKTEIYMDGYSQKNNFYHFDELNKQEFIDLGVISNVLLEKYKEQIKEHANWMEKLDENDKNIYF